MTKIIEDVKISGNDKTGYTVSYYEWVEGQGRDCGLNRTSQPFETRREAKEYADELTATTKLTDREINALPAAEVCRLAGRVGQVNERTPVDYYRAMLRAGLTCDDICGESKTADGWRITLTNGGVTRDIR